MKKVVTFLLVLALGITTMFTALPQMTKGASAAGEVRGLWVAFCDFQSLGLANKSRSTYTRNVGKLLDKAKYYGTNTIYFHARAFDDATWKSKTFKACSYLTGKASGSRTAYKTYSYDPLAIVIKECRKRNLKIEAWLNPYRVTYGTFLNPASAYSTLRIERGLCAEPARHPRVKPNDRKPVRTAPTNRRDRRESARTVGQTDAYLPGDWSI